MARSIETMIAAEALEIRLLLDSHQKLLPDMDNFTSSAIGNALELRGFGIAFGERIVLNDLSTELPRRGMTVVVGPAGGGKSTLLRTLSGLNDAHPSLKTWGEIRLGTKIVPLEKQRHAFINHPRPTLVVQHARFFLDTVGQNLISGLPNRAAHDRATQLELARQALRENGLDHLDSALQQEAVSLSLADQRCLAVVRAALAEPALLFSDESTAGLDEAGAATVVRLLRMQAERRSVLFVTHHQQLARLAGGTTLLLAHGKIQESTRTERFFSNPSTELGRQFVTTGSCHTSAPRCHEEHGESLALPQTQPISNDPTPGRTDSRSAVRFRHARPRGFTWTIAGKLGGLPRPGIIDDLTEDLLGLSGLGVNVLVTLEERRSLDAAELARYGIESVHFPIVDMRVPTLEDTLVFCARVREWLDAGQVVAFHCRAGYGRTGTMLACQLIFAGESARDALEHVRNVNPRHVQSDEQVTLLRRLELRLCELRSGSAGEPIHIDPISRCQQEREANVTG